MKNEASHIAIIILAAGASTRMGTAKQLLKWQDSTLLESAIDTALKLGTDEVVVVLGASYDAIKKEIEHYPITILKNEDWRAGLGKSLACGVNYLLTSSFNFDGCLVALADQPFITSIFFKHLIHVFNKKESSIIATSYKNETYGVPAVFDKLYFKELSMLNEDKGAKQLLKIHKALVKVLTPEIDNIDLDTIEDYQKYSRKV